ncbi:hypothetical protein EMPS_02141 [Entomortierella parvispora]|uniref:Sucrase/ferredoxin-like-domain-containing protein n=1 Tax=Entomortierella parvispora TaxID=205924 RepID=A0A9P3H4W2_9FUNG|nr:hypothetical protein EMPS_02141 [Entomortierella parvispora]
MIITAAIALNLAKSLVLKNTAPVSPSVITTTTTTTTETLTSTTEPKTKKEKKGPKPAPEQGSTDVHIPYVTLSDCHACPTPCPEENHPHYPSYLKIDQETPLLDSMRPYTRHVLISTGKDDWEAHIDDDKDSLAPYLQKAIEEGQARLKEENGGRDLPRIVLTNSSKHGDSWEGEGWQVVILPDQIVVNNVTKDQCHDFFEAFLRPPVGSVAATVEAEHETESKALEVAKEELNGQLEKTNGHVQDDEKSESNSSVTVNATQNGSKTTVVTTTTTTTTRKVSSSGSTISSSSSTTAVDSPSSKGTFHHSTTDQVRTVKAGNTTFTAHRWLPRAAIMICSHRKRDKRCGVTAPILQKEFKRILRAKDIYGDCEGDVEIWLVSHIGGHKFAGNVIVHKQEGMAVWYGRVDPCHCEAIVESTIERGEVLKELYRGSMVDSFDLSRKKIAW